MREPVDAERARVFMRALAGEAEAEGRVYFAGGVTAVLLGWRPSTTAADIHLVPDSDRLLRAIPRLKDALHINVELTCPAHFIPELPAWAERSPLIVHEGHVWFHHYDLYSQALAKVERDHVQDREDVHQMVSRGLVEASRLRAYFEDIRPRLYRYPAIDPASFERALVAALGPA